MAHRDLQSKSLPINQNKLIKKDNTSYNLPGSLSLTYCFYDGKKLFFNPKSKMKMSNDIMA